MGSLIRALRREKGLTLEQLGVLTGLSKSYLSKVERDLSMPSISVATSLAGALNVDVSRLFVQDGKRVSIFVDRPTKADEVAPLLPLGSGVLGKTMSPFFLRPSTEFVRHEPRHRGQELVFVHTGQIELHYDGESYILEMGESAYMDATRTHRLRRTSGSEAQVLIVTTLMDF